MQPKRAPIFALLAIALGVLVVACFTPLLVAGWLRTWIWWVARAEGLTVQIAEVEAPLGRPVVLHDVHVRSIRPTADSTELDLKRAELDLNLAGWFRRSGTRTLRALTVDGAKLRVHHDPALAGKRVDHARPLKKLLADSFRINDLEVRVESGSTSITALGVSLSASEIETGSVHIASLAVSSPAIAQSFSQLRGATSWQNQRLTLGAITLARGIDLDAFTADLSHLAAGRIGVEINVDAFGGKVRANVSSEEHDGRRLWDFAATATDVSLAQMSEMLNWTDRATGSVRAGKLTFRGSSDDLLQSTASIWIELDAATWRERTVDSAMLGASIYNHRVHLEQLYLKQPQNQLTLSGDFPVLLRQNHSWLRELDADLSANLKDVDAFARLFGAPARAYSGHLVVEAAVGIENPKTRDHLTATGEMQIANVPLGADSQVSAQISYRGTSALVESAKIGKAAGAEVGFHGEMQFGDLHEMTGTFSPVQPLFAVSELSTKSASAGSRCCRQPEKIPETESPF